MPFDDVDVFRAITDQEVIHIQRTFDTRRNDLKLIFKPNRVTERILPCGTPISWLYSYERHEPNLAI